MKHTLSPEAFRSTTWSQLTKTLQNHLQALRELNDVTRDEVSTAEIRGQIKAVKNILDLSKGSSEVSGQPDIPADHLAELEALGISPLSET